MYFCFTEYVYIIYYSRIIIVKLKGNQKVLKTNIHSIECPLKNAPYAGASNALHYTKTFDFVIMRFYCIFTTCCYVMMHILVKI